MNTLTTPNYFGPDKMPDTGRFLTDAEYRLIQNNVVIGCTDVLIVDESTGEALSGYRQQKPQEGYWFSCGGRMERGQSYQEAGAAKIKEELGLEIDPSRLELLTAYSTAFDKRAQEPQEEGVHTSNAVVVLFVSPEERLKMQFQLNEEHSKTEWMPLEEILDRHETFPPVLRDAIEKVEKSMYRNFSRVALKEFFNHPDSGVYTVESVGFPEKDFVVPQGQVFFKVDTFGMQSNNEPWGTSILSILGGETVNGRNKKEANKYSYEEVEGVLLAPDEIREVKTYLLGIPVTTVLKNKDGYGQVIRAVELPQELVNQASKVASLFNDPRDIPHEVEVFERFRLERQIRRQLKMNQDYRDQRVPRPAAHWMVFEYFPDGSWKRNGFHYPTPEDPDLERPRAG